jgi:hypothetical protein
MRRIWSKPSSNSSICSEKQLSKFQYEFLKSYLFRLHRGDTSSREITIFRLLASADMFSNRSMPLSITDDAPGKFVRVHDMNVLATVSHAQKEYDLSIFMEPVMNESIRYAVSAHGLRSTCSEPEKMLKILLDEAVRSSPFGNGLLEIGAKRQSNTDDPINEIHSIEIDSHETLRNIYLPKSTRREIEYFIRSVKEFGSRKRTLRYLLSGKPGTAKTRLIRAIANACSGDATFIFTSGSERRIESLFEFARIFSPVVLCIDDIDMMTGSREEGLHNSLLALFLQKLDGFVQNELFLLATTNEKRLVDYAASRPGRFDSLIDISCIEPEQYLSLVKSKTENLTVIDLFDDCILEQLESKRVTGAFIANLVKHLETVQAFEPELLSRDYLAGRIKESYEGFYKQPEHHTQSLGFN